MVGADPESRLCLCKLVCLHKHTHTHTHTFIKLFCFHRTSGDFPQTEFFTSKEITLDRQKLAENFPLTGSCLSLKIRRENIKSLSFYHYRNRAPITSNNDRETKTPSRYLQFHCAFLIPRFSVRHRLRCLTKKGCGSLPTSRGVCCQVRNTSLETVWRSQPGQRGSEHHTAT